MVAAITTVWTSMMEWITTSLGSVQELFYSTETSNLTFLGVLCVITVGISVVFLLINTVQSFLHLRG